MQGERKAHLWTPQRVNQTMHMAAVRMHPQKLAPRLHKGLVARPDGLGKDVVEEGVLCETGGGEDDDFERLEG